MPFFYTIFLIFMTAALAFYINRVSRALTLSAATTHPGSIVVVFFYLYCVIPTLFFITNTIEGAAFQWFDFNESQLVSHLMRSALFFVVLILTLLFTSKPTSVSSERIPPNVTNVTLILCSLSFVVASLVLLYLSAPVTDYYSFYLRFDHLSGLPAVLVSICKRLVWGLTPITIFLLSVRYVHSLKMYLLGVGAIVAFLILTSYGARIDAMLAIIQAACYRGLWSRQRVSVLQIILIVPSIAFSLFAFKYIEIVRLDGASTIEISLNNALLLAPGEFFALLFPSIELYELHPSQIPVGWDLYIKDLIAVIPFYDNSERDLMYWYWQTFVPSAPVAPYTLGVLADPAILGGWWLLVEAVVIGYSATMINRLRTTSNVYALAAFGYLSSVGILVLKYNMFVYIEFLLNNFLPAAFVLWVITSIQGRSENRR